ncbi:hypothetical protein [Chryseobacterium sp. JUb7]|uniref:hypothetical protein n=1 Tax=Chryseobacterium sp. JUb7 TaxID=2940599 RepID=UPI002167B5E2|nr:hypothetical protein [Chryseobacterium sp. JUb7]MCS3532992.1 hypothetical protein [Chryseobacterium sp. JUb7]
MKKLSLSIIVALSGYYSQVNAQIGINNGAPASTLDITAKNPVGTDTNVDGILIPRVDRQRAQSMASVPTSTLIYVNSVATGTTGGTAVNIDATGYYYFNGTVWMKLNPSSTPNSVVNIYNSDGTLTDNRIVTQGSNTLSFVGTAANAFSVDGSTFSVDAANDRVGVGTIAPTVKLQVQGSQLLNAALTGAATKNALDINVGQDGFGYGNRADNYGINMKSSSSIFPGTISRINFGDTSTGTAVGPRYMSFSVGITPNELMYLTDANAGRVGIGTVSPASRFHVDGGESRFSNTTSAWALAPSTGGTTGASNSFEVVDRVNNVRRMVFNDNGDMSLGGTIVNNSAGGVISIRSGNVGIGTASPSNILHVNATNPVRLEGLQVSSGSAGTLAVNSTGVVQLRNSSSISAVRATGNITITVNNTFTNIATAAETFDNLNEFAGNTFTAAATGLYKVDFQIVYPQRGNTEDGGDGYMAYARISLNGSAYGNLQSSKVPLPEVSGAPSSISVTNSALVKMNAGNTLTFDGLTFGSTPNTTNIIAPFVLSIVRID